MSLMNDRELLALFEEKGVVSPYSTGTVRRKGPNKPLISYGMSSSGYDVRLGRDVKLFNRLNSIVIDPKNFDERTLSPAEIRKDDNGDEYTILPPNSYMLGHTLETLDVPDDISILCIGKSSLARCGLEVNVTPVWSGFKGQVVLEAANTTDLPMRVYIGEGFATLLFFKSNSPCIQPYDGVYQGQSGVTLASVEKGGAGALTLEEISDIVNKGEFDDQKSALDYIWALASTWAFSKPHVLPLVRGVKYLIDNGFWESHPVKTSGVVTDLADKTRTAESLADIYLPESLEMIKDDVDFVLEGAISPSLRSVPTGSLIERLVWTLGSSFVQTSNPALWRHHILTMISIVEEIDDRQPSQEEYPTYEILAGAVNRIVHLVRKFKNL